METVGQKIKRFRLEKKLTQYQLAKVIGVDQSLIALYERDGKIPNNISRDKLANALSIPYIYLRDGIIPPNPNDIDYDSYDDYMRDNFDNYMIWVNSLVQCKKELSDDNFKKLFEETQSILNDYRIALDINILIDDVDKYSGNMKPDDLKQIFDLPDKYLDEKTQK